MPNLSHRATAYAQILITVVFIGGYFLVLHDFIHGRINVPPEWKDSIKSLLDLLTAGVLMILQYWFSRMRASSGGGS